jgi:isocitrate dehydrogenase (NAD+)
MSYNITIIPGDGIGPEVTAAARICLESTGVKINWDIQEAGEAVIKKEGTPLPERVLESIRKNKVALKGPITTPVGYGFRSVNVSIRKKLDLYACVRPVKYFSGVKTPIKDVDIVVVRENTEGLYAGIEFKSGEEETKNLIEFLKKTNRAVSPDSGISLKPVSVKGSKRIAEYAFKYARDNGRKKVSIVQKANIMKFTDGLFLDIARKIAGRYPDIENESILVDNLAMQLVQNPEKFDVLLLPNLYGDIISDLLAGLTGGLGMAPGVNIGNEYAVFEPTHGSVPELKGKDMVNPSAAILSGVMMLRYIGENKKAAILRQALSDVIKEGERVTFDLQSDNKKQKPSGTREMAKAICKRIYELQN